MAPDHGMSFFDYPTSQPENADRAQVSEVLLPDATKADWTTILEFTQARRFSAGQCVLEAGSGGGSLYVVLEGAIGVLAPRGRFGRAGSAGLMRAAWSARCRSSTASPGH